MPAEVVTSCVTLQPADDPAVGLRRGLMVKTCQEWSLRFDSWLASVNTAIAEDDYVIVNISSEWLAGWPWFIAYNG